MKTSRAAHVITGSGLMGRDITNIRSCDMVVIAGGPTGTLGELAIAYDEGRLIGVLTGQAASRSSWSPSSRPVESRRGHACSTTTIQSGSSIG